ncbi:peptidase, M23 family [Leptospira inadai serovar Lyme str. 10]|uniref:Peptidase, M23 family n=1 Tax=Leptospira inadai serovar Lyme str. 10 TaxID=1049790 RepID=V6HH58_9LEPT|nr:LysM peptidoglycan-binding domain-containing M23 family metallopeptidase [Leptospira inadai]EQA35475.1 peptidase, M23 family [Leptospira inadai serovar Lyme str. 10]
MRECFRIRPILFSLTAGILFLLSQASEGGTRSPSGSHTVQFKETAFSIAKKHGIDWRLLLEWNGKKESDGLRKGEVLRLPPNPSKNSAPKGEPIGLGTASTRPKFRKPLERLPPVALPFSKVSYYPNKGVLFKAGRHKEVRTVSEGKVVVVDQMDGYRKYIILEHSGGYSTIYANLRSVGVKEGESVKKGATVGELEEGRGLYFQINQGAKALDPIPFVSR